MKIEQQCVSLELSTKLKELGVEQESIFVWDEKERVIFIPDNDLRSTDVSAFTVAELGNMLVDGRSGNEMPRGFWCSHRNDDGEQQWEKTEANARAAMLIYLLENKLI